MSSDTLQSTPIKPEREYHACGHLFFARNSDGSVTIRKNAHPDYCEAMSPITLSADVWASVVASMSYADETFETWQAARNRQLPPASQAAPGLRDHQDILTHAKDLLIKGDRAAGLQQLKDLRTAEPKFKPAEIKRLIEMVDGRIGFAIGDEVEWRSSANGSTRTKRGKIVAIVGPSGNPYIALKATNPELADRLRLDAGLPRQHTSYVVLVPTGLNGGGRGKLYWPIASKLRKVA
jgi:hypothetical protein